MGYRLANVFIVHRRAVQVDIEFVDPRRIVLLHADPVDRVQAIDLAVGRIDGEIDLPALGKHCPGCRTLVPADDHPIKTGLSTPPLAVLDDDNFPCLFVEGLKFHRTRPDRRRERSGCVVRIRVDDCRVRIVQCSRYKWI